MLVKVSVIYHSDMKDGQDSVDVDGYCHISHSDMKDGVDVNGYCHISQ